MMQYDNAMRQYGGLMLNVHMGRYVVVLIVGQNIRAGFNGWWRVQSVRLQLQSELSEARDECRRVQQEYDKEKRAWEKEYNDATIVRS